MNTSNHTYNKDFDPRLFGRDATGAARSQSTPADATATRTQPTQQQQAAKTKAKDPPEFRITEVSIVVPSDGLKKDQQFDITGKIQPLVGTLTKKTLRIELVALYKGTEDRIGTAQADINTSANTFAGTCKQLFYHNEYVKDKEKPADAKFTLEARASSPGAEKDAVSKPVELPMATTTIILKKGTYDDTWVKGHEATHPKSGKEYVPDNKVKKLQETMADFRFFKYTERKERITGFFDDATHKAVWDFQECARKPERKKGTDTRIIKADKITLTDPPDGEVGPNTEKEIAVWLQNNWVKPEPEFRKNDIDDNGVKNKHGERGGETHHPGTMLTEFQKTLKDIVAYSGKIDGWFFNNLEKALSIFHDHAVKGEFVDAKGNKVVLDEKDRLKDFRKGVVNGDTIKVAEKVKEKGLKIPSVLKEPKWIEIAKNEIGTKEIPGEKHNDKIVEYFSATTLKAKTDETPWCSAFANWVFQQAGIDGTKDARAVSWKNWGKKLEKPAYGAIAVVDFPEGGNHVGFIVGKKTYPGNRDGLLMLGGNQGTPGSVKVSWYKIKELKYFAVPEDFNDMNYDLKDIEGEFKEETFATTR